MNRGRLEYSRDNNVRIVVMTSGVARLTFGLGTTRSCYVDDASQPHYLSA